MTKDHFGSRTSKPQVWDVMLQQTSVGLGSRKEEERDDQPDFFL